ncbi:hypothetical protein [Amycolatopsis sp. NPDC052450]|uniref:hypothetical protein n=1 Tax=Amycolatopsis sp. NPDC052450 TaxID=3363937 RepID=UPI0037CA3361
MKPADEIRDETRISSLPLVLLFKDVSSSRVARIRCRSRPCPRLWEIRRSAMATSASSDGSSTRTRIRPPASRIDRMSPRIPCTVLVIEWPMSRMSKAVARREMRSGGKKVAGPP